MRAVYGLNRPIQAQFGKPIDEGSDLSGSYFINAASQLRIAVRGLTFAPLFCRSHYFTAHCREESRSSFFWPFRSKLSRWRLPAPTLASRIHNAPLDERACITIAQRECCGRVRYHRRSIEGRAGSCWPMAFDSQSAMASSSSVHTVGKLGSLRTCSACQR